MAFLKKWYADRLHFMDTNFLAKPVFNNNTGAFTPGFALTLGAAAGATIYYTTNGADPRAAGGGISSNALVYTGPIVLQTNVSILARARDTSHHNLTGADNPPPFQPVVRPGEPKFSAGDAAGRDAKPRGFGRVYRAKPRRSRCRPTAGRRRPTNGSLMG